MGVNDHQFPPHEQRRKVIIGSGGPVALWNPALLRELERHGFEVHFRIEPFAMVKLPIVPYQGSLA